MRTLIATLLLAATVQAAPVPPAQPPDPLGRAFLGIREPAAAQGGGLPVGEVIPGTSAHRGGIRAGDKIISVGGVEVNWFYQLQQELGMYRPGAVVNIEIERDKKKYVLKVRLGERPEPDAQVIEEP